MMVMSKVSKPKIIQIFENLLWAKSPSSWTFNTTYFHSTLFVVIVIEQSNNELGKKIRRNYNIDIVKQFCGDLHGLAGDCVDEIKTEIGT